MKHRNTEKIPQSVEYCFRDGLYDDINELINYFHQMQQANPQKTAIIIRDLFTSLKPTKPVTFFTLGPLFRHFKITDGPRVQVERIPRFFMTNILISNGEQESFFISCGLIKSTNLGKGSHAAWKNSENKVITMSQSKDLWLKPKIKEMLENGLPIEVIANACKRMNIEFRMLS